MITRVAHRGLVLAHRYLGIPLSIMFVVWLVSGVVMIYTGGMPALADEDRLIRAEAIDLAAVQLSPSQALAAVGAGGTPDELRLETVLGRPAYRVRASFGRSMTVFADTGQMLEEVAPNAAAAVAARFSGRDVSELRFVATLIEPDQWTLTQQRDLPLHEFDSDDGMRIYVSAAGGDVVLTTTRASRTLAWLGVIPHWLYFSSLRLNQPLWYWTVVTLAGLGCMLALMGITLAVTQFRRSRPFSLERSVRYRGWMRWHYFSGVLFGLFALTWVFSGLMSMEPFAWTNLSGLRVPRDALSGGALEVDRYPALANVRWPDAIPADAVKEIRYVRILDEPHLLVSTATDLRSERVRERLHQPYPLTLAEDPGRRLVRADTLQLVEQAFSSRAFVERIAGAVEAPVRNYDLLAEYDAYYYSRDGGAPLPVLRIRFDDPLQTTVYVDPAIGRVVASTHRYSRLERWLFNGLHSLDFDFWYDRRPWWDLGMIVLSLGALTTSLIGMYLGIARLGRNVRSRQSR